MNLSLYIALKIVHNKQKNFSQFIIQLSITAIAISVAVMILGMSFMNGFEDEIHNKAYSFWGHIRIEKFIQNNEPVSIQAEKKIESKENNHLSDLQHIEKTLQLKPDILFFTSYAQKYGIILSEYSLEGVAFKGYSSSFSTDYFKKFLVKGTWLNFSNKNNEYLNQIVISQHVSQLLKLDTGDFIIANFIEQDRSQRKRKLKIVGIYKTGIEEYDKIFAFVDIALIQNLNQWNTNQFNGYEVFLKNSDKINSVNKELYQELPNEWTTRTTKEITPHLFEWIELLHVNKWVLIIILSCVAMINMIACMATFVLERSRMIGLLKTFGMPSFKIQQVFIYYATYVSFLGIFIGLLLGLAIAFLQYYFGFIQLDEATYFVNQAPIKIDFIQIITTLILSVIICFLILILPSYYIQRLKPIKSIQIES